MDYSLLVGIHQLNRDSGIMHPGMGERIEILSVFTPDRSSQSRYQGNSVIVRKVSIKTGKTAKKKTRGAAERTTVTFGLTPFAMVLPVSLETHTLQNFFGGIRGSNANDEPISEVYFVGIIDFLQTYGAGKATEHFFKKVVYDKSEMSCVRPEKYAARMFAFLLRTIGPAEPLTADEEEQILRRSQRLMEMVAPLPPPPLPPEPPEEPEPPKGKRAKDKRWKPKKKAEDDAEEPEPPPVKRVRIALPEPRADAVDPPPKKKLRRQSDEVGSPRGLIPLPLPDPKRKKAPDPDTEPEPPSRPERRKRTGQFPDPH
jgi:hypothetical protein